MIEAPRRIRPEDDLESFGCGNDDLDHWLRARSRSSEGISARTFVVVDSGRVVGFYSLSAGSVIRRALPRRIRHNNPEQVPIILIGRLAVDLGYHGRGLGSAMLRDALTRSLVAASTIGVRAVVVHAIDDAAVRFYLDRGFLKSAEEPRTLILPVETIAEALA